SVTTFLNGKRLYTREYKWLYDDGTLAPPAHILMNLAIGGPWAGRNGVDVASFPQQLKVDYIRVCQYVDVGGSERCSDSAFAPTSLDGRYETAFHDLPKTALTETQVTARTLRPGMLLNVAYAFDAVPTAENHTVNTQLVDKYGK